MSFLQSIFSRNARPARHAPSVEARLHGMFEKATFIVAMTGTGFSGARRPHVTDGAEVPVRFRHFLIDPEARLKQWRRSLAEADACAAAKPNGGHASLALFARTRRLKVVTLNTDGLHARAGMHQDDLVEINGNVGSAVCIRCGRRTPIGSHAASVAAGVSPICERDGEMLKPAHTLFGEMPLRSPLIRSEEWGGTCDLLIVAGTSLTKGPANATVNAARQAGAFVAAVGETGPVDGFEADIVVEGDASEIVAALAK